MNLNTNQPMTQGQLASLYTGNPNLTPDQVNSNLFTQSSQGYGYVQDQARNLGINDPAAYFNNMLTQKQLANTQSGAQAEAMRQAGQYSPQSLPGQLQARNNMADQVTALQAQQSQQNQTQIAQNTDRAFPIPTPGVAPTMTPVMQAAMQQSGYTDPNSFILQQRVNAAGLNSAVAPIPNTPGATVSPDALYNEPSFRAIMQNNPQQAQKAFGALTGRPLFGSDQSGPGFHETYQAAQQEQQKNGVATLQESLKNQDARANPDGTISWRQQITDPAGSGKPITSNTYGPGTAYQKSIEKFLPLASGALGQFQAQASSPARQAWLAQQAAKQQTGTAPVPDNSRPISMQTSPVWGNGILGTANNAMQGMVSDVSNVLSGQPQTFADSTLNQAQGFDAPGGSAVMHARPLLANNPQFQQLLKTNPDAARRMILAIQMHGQQ